jgi:hypothetical protein
VLWIIYGALGLLGGLSSIAAHASGPGIGQIVIALAFIITGIQVLMGKASSLLGSGIACLLLAGVGVFAALTLQRAASAGLGHVADWIFVVIMINCALLATAGVLAIVGNTKYKSWRASRGK